MPDLADVVVVGGGILGAAITMSLARRNLRVTLLEAGRLAQGATGNGFGWVNATAKTDDEAYFRLNAQAVTHYDRLASEWGAERLGVHAGGTLFWTDDDDAAGRERLRTRAHLLQSWNYPAALLSPGEVAALEPHVTSPSGKATNAAGEKNAPSALFAPADKWVDTARLCRFFVEQARANKADIRLDCAATGFTRSVHNAISTVETPQGRVSTRLLVLAAGLDTPRLAASVAGNAQAARYTPVHPVPGLLVQTPPLAPGQSCGRVLYPPDANGLHLRPAPDGGLLLGADDTDALLTDLSNQSVPDTGNHGGDSNPHSIGTNNYASYGSDLLQRVPPALWQGLLERAARHLPALSNPGVIAASLPRVCVRPVPADGLPIVGALPGVPGAYVVVTHSGVTLGPLLAELLAGEIFTRISAPALTAYRPDRF